MVLEVTIIARGGLMMADILVLAITWRATRATLKAGRDIRALGQATSLSAILFQYGECHSCHVVAHVSHSTMHVHLGLLYFVCVDHIS